MIIMILDYSGKNVYYLF